MREATLINTTKKEYKEADLEMAENAPQSTASDRFYALLGREIEKRALKLKRKASEGDVKIDFCELERVLTADPELASQINGGAPIEVIASWEFDKKASAVKDIKLVTFASLNY